MVSLPRAKDQAPESHHDPNRPSVGGSDRFCFHQSFRLSYQHGAHGRYKSPGEACEHLRRSSEEELDGLAGCTDAQLYYRTARAQAYCGKCGVHRLELLFELCQQQEIKDMRLLACWGLLLGCLAALTCPAFGVRLLILLAEKVNSSKAAIEMR